jgi:hypothetical protein
MFKEISTQITYLRKKTYFLFFIFFNFFVAKASEIRNIEIDKTTLYYHFCKSSKQSDKLLIFLHGSISTFQGQVESKPKDLNTLLEFNKDFIATFGENGYDIIIPVAYNEYNWLDMKGDLFIDSLFKAYKQNYSNIYLSGFSDGATGSFKYFHNNPSRFHGLVLFNGYPQHNNYYKGVDHKKIIDHKILFLSQKHDKVVPYEFLLIEYRRQKITNSETYFMLFEGDHDFSTYNRLNFEKCINILETSINIPISNHDSIWIFPPVDGLIIKNELLETYQFRNSIARKFGMDKSEYKSNLTNTQKLVELTKHGNPKIMPLKVSRQDLLSKKFDFAYSIDGKEGLITIQNYLVSYPW